MQDTVKFPAIQDIFKDDFYHEGKYIDVISSQTLEKIYEYGLFKCFLPKKWGGLELELEKTLEVIEQTSYMNGSLGWIIQIGNGGNYFASLFSEVIAEELFSPKNAVLAGSGTPDAIAIPTQNGYIINGQWKYCSGADYATFFTFNSKIENSEEMICITLMRDQVQIIPEWNNTLGMKYTSTHTVKAQSAFVPTEKTFWYTERKGLYEYPIYDLPFLPYAQSFIIHNLYGMFNRFLKECLNAIQSYQSSNSKVNIIQNIIEEATSYLNQARVNTLETIQKIYAKNANRDFLINQLSQITSQQKEKIMQYAHQIFPLMGMQVLYLDHPINIFYRDIITAGQHVLLN